MGTTALAALVCLICLLASAAAQTLPPPGAPNLLTVQFIIRDVVGQGSTGVNKTTHPDFERANAAETGMVAYRLGADRVRSSRLLSSPWRCLGNFDVYVAETRLQLVARFDHGDQRYHVLLVLQ